MIRNRDLRYSLSLDREEFEQAEAVVKAVLLTAKRKQGPFDTLVRATENYDQLADSDREFIVGWDRDSKGELEGLCCWPDKRREFSIWLNPQLDPMQDPYRIALLHELVHGYMNYNTHDAKFRDVLGRVLYHYCDIVGPLTNPSFHALALNYRYTKSRPDEKENDYMYRIIEARDRTQAKAEAEYSDVLAMFERIS